MIKKILDIYKKYQEIINYLVTGGIGTIVSIGSFAILLNIGIDTIASNIISWIIVVVLMYVLNRYFVFKEHANTFKAIIIEIIAFVSARIITLILETLIVWLGIDIMHFNAIIIKTLAQIMVIVLNYIASKLIIFKDKKESKK